MALATAATELRFTTSHGRFLGGRVFRGAAAAERSVVLLGALAAPQHYLQSTAEWLATLGYGVLSFDYRGVGASQFSGDPTSNLDHWGDDTRAAIRAAREAFSPKTLLAVGHSLGGMLLGHSGAGAEVDGALLVASTHGRTEYYQGLGRLRVEAAYRVLPRVARLLGGLPRMFLTTRVPRDVVVHWTRWGGQDQFTHWNGDSSEAAFAALAGPVIGVAVEGDDYAPVQAVDALLARFTSAGVRREVLSPRAHGGPNLGHFGLFSSRAPDWARAQVARWLEELEEAAHV